MFYSVFIDWQMKILSCSNIFYNILFKNKTNKSEEVFFDFLTPSLIIVFSEELNNQIQLSLIFKKSVIDKI